MHARTKLAAAKRLFPFTFVAAVVIAALGASAVPSQAAVAQKTAVVTLDFPFTVNGTTLPAGRYHIVADLHHVVVRPVSPELSAVVLPVVARVGESAPDHAQVVFEKVGGEYHLSQLWIPGFDGFQLSSAAGKEAAGKWASNR